MRLQQSLFRVTVVACTLTLVGVWAAARPSLGAFTSQVTNSNGTVTTGKFLWSHSYPNGASGPTSCVGKTTAIDDSNQQINCSNSTLPTTGVGSATDAITANTTYNSSAVTETVKVPSCGPIKLADTATPIDPMLARGTTTFQQSGPISGSGSIGLDGSTSAAVDVTQANVLNLLGPNFTEGIWFKVANGYSGGGALIAFGDSASTTTQTSYDHLLFMNKAGNIVFGHASGGALVSPAKYNDGSWHLAVLSEGSVQGGISASLYVDGSLVSSGLQVTLLAAYSGYWHVGWDTLTRFDTTASPYLAGNVSNAFVLPLTTTASAVSALYSSASQSSWNAQMTSLSALHSWTFGDSGTAIWTGIQPVIGTNSACSYITLAGSATTTPATSTSSFTATALSAMSSGATLIAPPANYVQNLTLTLARNGNYAAASDYLNGLDIYAPQTITFGLNGTAAWYSTFTWSGTRTSSTDIGIPFVLA